MTKIFKKKKSKVKNPSEIKLQFLNQTIDKNNKIEDNLNKKIESVTNEQNLNNEKEIEKTVLKHKIIKKIEKNLEEKNNELEIINSEIYVLNQITDENKTIEEIEEQQKKIKEMKEKIERIKEQLKIYENNEVLKKAILLDEKSIIDDILDYKRMIENEENLKEEYEVIEGYTYLVEQVDKVNDKCIELEIKKEKELERLNMTEEEFEDLQLKIVKEQMSTESIKKMIEEQGEEMQNIEEKIEIIESKIDVTYNYELLNKMIAMELRYLALISLSPFQSTLPFIAFTILTTKDMIMTLSNQKLIKIDEKTIYYAKDYAQDIENLQYKLNDMTIMLIDNLYNIEKIKEHFSNNPQLLNNTKYKEFVTKIEKIETMLKDSMAKMEIHKSKVNKNKNKNKRKLKKVLELNNE